MEPYNQWLDRMSNGLRHSWARPIIFEGVELPGIAFAIDHLGMYGNLPELSEEASLWLWRFTICAGRTRDDDSTTVLRVVEEVLEQAESNRSQLLASVPDRFDGPFEDQDLDEWLSALQTIRNIAQTKERCTWGSPDAV